MSKHILTTRYIPGPFPAHMFDLEFSCTCGWKHELTALAAKLNGQGAGVDAYQEHLRAVDDTREAQALAWSPTFQLKLPGWVL